MTEVLITSVGRQVPRAIEQHFAKYGVGSDHLSEPFRVTQDEVSAFTRLFNDTNPIHTSESGLGASVVPALMIPPLITKHRPVPTPYELAGRQLGIKETGKTEYRKPMFVEVDEARVKYRLLEVPRATALGVMIPVAYAIVVDDKDIVRGSLTLTYFELRN